MASVSLESNGKFSVRFRVGGKETRLRGFGNRRDAQRFAGKVDDLLAAKKTGTVAPELTVWADSLLKGTPDVYDKLASAGLVPERQKPKTLVELVSLYCSDNSKKPRTLRNRRNVGDLLLKFFGGNRTLDSFTRKDADAIYSHMKSLYSVGNLQRQTVFVKSFFLQAIEWGWLSESPFSRLKGGSKVNRQRDFYVTEEMAQKILEACPNARWRLIFSLGRWGGLRIPSELAFLKWSDVLWQQGKFRVSIPKKTSKEAQAAGDMATRFVPLFQELQKAFRELWEELPVGSGDLIFPEVDPNYLSSTPLRSELCRIIRRAGLEPWAKLFANMRSTRDTELQRQYPIHLVCSWLGHSPEVSLRHYVQVTDSDFLEAAGESVHKSVHTLSTKASTHCIAYDSTFSQQDSQAPQKCGDLQEEATDCNSTQSGPDPLVGGVRMLYDSMRSTDCSVFVTYLNNSIGDIP